MKVVNLHIGMKWKHTIQGWFEWVMKIEEYYDYLIGWWFDHFQDQGTFVWMNLDAVTTSCVPSIQCKSKYHSNRFIH